MQNVWSNNLKSVAIKKKRSKEILATKNCVNLNIQILSRIYLVMLEKKSIIFFIVYSNFTKAEKIGSY